MTRFLSFAFIVALVAGGAPSLSAQSFTGTAPTASDPFTLQAGLVMVELEHQGTGQFRARLLDQSGAVVEELAGTTGAFTGSRAVQIPRSDQYLLDVVADGEWRVRIRPFGDVSREALEAFPELEEARAVGVQAGGEPGTWGWFGGGLAGGVLTGPIGTTVATVMAGRPPEVPSAMLEAYAGGDPVLGEAFREAYQAELRSRRQRSALRGGIIGTAFLAFAIIKWTDLARPSGTGDGNGGDLLNLVPVPR